MGKTIFVYDGAGQTCNRFWSLLPVIVRKMRTKENVCVLVSGRQLANFPTLLAKGYLIFPFYNNLLYRFLGFNKANYIYYILFNNKFFIIGYKCINKLLGYDKFVDSWKETLDFHYLITDQEKEIIRKIFLPSDAVRKIVDGEFQNFKNQSEIVIGVHIRRGDYKYFKQGIFYYDDKKYLDVMKQIEKLFSAKVSFLICTNENFEAKEFVGVNCYRLTVTNPVHELYALTLVDYIVGPPSSFSKWASFIGDVPLMELLPEQLCVSRNDFVIYNPINNRVSLALSNY
ncbi:MAG: alpha-1,2-fucosyltransferase [Bacteroides sp.]|nr:alpha-1,2-fucosyltransferase [Bacteroides sp.]